MKDADTLIEQLVSQMQPVRKPRSPLLIAAAWLAGALIYVALLVFIQFKMRPDLLTKLADSLFVAEISSLLALIVTTSISAAFLAFPDLHQKQKIIFLPVFAFLVFAGVLFLEWLVGAVPSAPPPHTMECLVCITILSLPPSFWMFYKIRRMATVMPQLAGCNALLASFGIGALVLRLSEPVDSIDHYLVWHYLPMIAVGAIGLWLGNKFFKW